MAAGDITGLDDSLYPIAVLIDELRNEDVQVVVDVFKIIVAIPFQKFSEVEFVLFIRCRCYLGG